MKRETIVSFVAYVMQLMILTGWNVKHAERVSAAAESLIMCCSVPSAIALTRLAFTQSSYSRICF